MTRRRLVAARPEPADPGTAPAARGNRRWGRFRGWGRRSPLWALAATAGILFRRRPPGRPHPRHERRSCSGPPNSPSSSYAVLWLSTTLNAFSPFCASSAPPRAPAPGSPRPQLSPSSSPRERPVTPRTLTGVGRDALGLVFAGGGLVQPIDGRYTVLLLGGDAGPDRLGGCGPTASVWRASTRVRAQ